MYQKSTIGAKFKPLLANSTRMVYSLSELNIIFVPKESLTVRTVTPLIYSLFILILHSTSTCQHIPVAILLNLPGTVLEADLTCTLDPILCELVLHLDQKHTPVIVSRQLLHALIRATRSAHTASLDSTTHLAFCKQLLTQYAASYDPTQTLSLKSAYIGQNLPVHAANKEEKFPELFQKIESCVSAQRCSLLYMLVNQLDLDAWQVFTVQKRNGTDSYPLYVLLPKSTDAPIQYTINHDKKSLKSIPIDVVKKTALTESDDVQQSDNQSRVYAKSIGRALQSLHANISTASAECSFIITLGGHGYYTRSSYGIVSDRLKPTELSELSALDQNAREPKDTAGCICAFSIDEFRQLLRILNTKVSTSFLYYDSCYTGNNHLHLPYLKKDGTPLTLNFTVATASADSGVSKRDGMFLGIDRNDPTNMHIKCPMNPKGFFENVQRWLNSSSNKDLLRTVLSPMLGEDHSIASMVRLPKAKTFTPHLDSQHVHVSTERARTMAEIIIPEPDCHLFLGHNVIKPPICGYVPTIRSLIATNGVHYIHHATCVDLSHREILQLLTDMFFHKQHSYAMNRMIFFIKHLKLTTSGQTHSLRDVFALHHRHSSSQKNNFVIWHTAKKRKPYKTQFHFARQSETGQLEENSAQPFSKHWTYQTILHYLSLGTQQQSYIEAPALLTAHPQAFDDAAIRTHCATACMDHKFTRKEVAKIWKLLGM